MSKVSGCQYPEKLLSLLGQSFEGVHILVLGDVLLDQSVYADSLAERRYKQPGLDVLKYEGGEKKHVGGAGTIARVVAAYGGTADLCGVTGRDDEGKLLRKILPAGVTFHPIIVEDRPTTVVHRLFVRTGRSDYEERTRADRESTVDLPDDVVARINTAVRRLVRKNRPNAVVVGDFDRGVARSKIINRTGAWLNRERIPIFVDPKRTGWETWEIELTAVFATAKEAWDALRGKDPAAWQDLGGGEYPPEWSSPADCESFVRSLMGACPNVGKLCINDPDGPMLAIARDEKLRGLYRYVLVDCPHSYRLQSPVGSESVPTAFLAMALSTNAQSPVYWDDFFCTAYAAKCLSRANMSTRAEEIADPSYLESILFGEEKKIWTWPELPQKESILSARSEYEVNLQQAIERLGSTIRLEDAKTDIPCVFAANAEFRAHLASAVQALRDLKDERAPPKPARLWIHGPSRIGKDFVVRQLVKGVLGCEMKIIEPNVFGRASFDAHKELREAQRDRRVLVADELDKVKKGVHSKFLIPLEDATLGSVFFVAMTSLANVEYALLEDLFNRLDPGQDARAVRINLPRLEDRMEDVPYLLVACLQRRTGKDRMPSRISKRALEVLLRAPTLNMQIINDAAKALVEAVGKKKVSATIDSSAMARSLGRKPKDVDTLYYNEADDEALDIYAYERWDEEQCSS